MVVNQKAVKVINKIFEAGITEELKTSDQMKWVGLMNNVRSSAEEIVLDDDGFIIGSSAQGTDHQLEGTGISRRHVRFYKEDGYYRLQPENDTMDPIIVDECTVLGKVFGVFRFL
mgnify:CR=1 FL=1